MKIEEAIHQKKFKTEHQKLIVNIAYTNSYLTHLLANELKPFDLSMQQYNVLRIMRGQHPEPVSINSITERMIDRMSNASRLVEKLRKKSLVERKVCCNDRRQVDIHLTEEGIKVLTQLDNIVPNVELHFNHLEPEEIKTLNSLLDKMRLKEKQTINN